jgi:TP901 family phage tail tape measure protein
MAKEVGLTTTEVANLSIAFFRQGRSAVDALRLTETAAKFAKIAAIDVNDAANFLTAAINGFNLAASDATRIVDRFAALGAGAAASAQEIAIALSKVAPAAASAGVEIDNLMAFVTKGIETTREAPENIGTAFKTIFARMRELTDIGKTIEDGMDVNRVEASLRSIGVALRDENGEFRNLDQVLIEVGQRWDSIDRNQQAYIATTLAGTRQQTRLIALFEDFDRTLELIELSQDSAGVAALQHTEYMQGLEAANSRLRTSFQELITSFVNSDMIIGFLNLLNDVLELANTGLGKVVISTLLLVGGFKLAAAKGLIQSGIMKMLIADTKALFMAKVGAAKGFSLFTAKIGLASAATAIFNAIAALNPFVWVGAAVVAIFGLVMAFQKVRKSTDTTNESIARMKIVFDVIIERVQELGKWVVDAFESMGRGIKKLLEIPGAKQLLGIAKTAARVGLAVSTFGASEAIFALGRVLRGDFLNSTQQAAAGFRVLTNQLKATNAEAFALKKGVQGISSSIDEFLRLDAIAFKTPQELRQWNEAQSTLRDTIKSFLQDELETGRITEFEFNQRAALLDASSGEALIDQANKINKEYQNRLDTLTTQNTTRVREFFEENQIS